MTRATWIAAAAAAAGLSAPSCGKSRPAPPPRADGVIARVGGELVKLAPGEVEAVCARHFCEPNYLYREAMGGSRPKPEPSPSPSPTTPPAGETFDYVKSLLGIPEAWKLNQGRPEIVVAVVDSGIDLSHPDLAANLWVNAREKNGRPGVDDDGNGYVDDVHGYDFQRNQPTPTDLRGHGTHCAGIIAAALNGLGTAGVAPRVRIMPLRFIAENGFGDTQNAVAAIRYAIRNGAHVISNSWVGNDASVNLAQAIQEARELGVFVVAAAGNTHTDLDAFPNWYPAAFPGVIAVAASDARDALWYESTDKGSNFGRRLARIAAPGDRIYSTVPQGRWEAWSGTSMAAPQVAGALALALSFRPGIAPEVLEQRLCESARPALRERVQCGRLDVLGLLRSL